MRSPMLLLLVAAVALVALPVYGDELVFAISPFQESTVPGTSPDICQITGAAPCVQFSGTLTDTDTDGSLLVLTGISINFSGSSGTYFTLDQNLFFNDVPGILEGDTQNNIASNTYTGPIFGIDLGHPIPAGIYTETAVISACNLINDPNCESGGPDPLAFTASAQFQVDVVPEPSAGSLSLLGLTALLASYGVKRKWRPAEVRSR